MVISSVITLPIAKSQRVNGEDEGRVNKIQNRDWDNKRRGHVPVENFITYICSILTQFFSPSCLRIIQNGHHNPNIEPETWMSEKRKIVQFTYKVPTNAKSVANIDARMDIPGLKMNSSPSKWKLVQPFCSMHVFGFAIVAIVGVWLSIWGGWLSHISGFILLST